MIFFVANDGTVINSVPSPVYQGAANTNNIYVVAPFAANLQASVAFKLPNGVYTARYPMAQVNKLNGVVDEKTGKTFNGWRFALPNEITQYYGTVTVQFFFYSAQGGVITATSSTSFVVDKGVPSVLPSTPNEDVYDAILNNLSIMSVQLDNGAFTARSVYQWNSTYVYGAGEITYYADFGEYGAFVKSLKVDNQTEPFVNGVLSGDSWQLISDFNILTDLYDLQENAALSAQKAAQSASEAAQAVENGKTEITQLVADGKSEVEELVAQAETAEVNAASSASEAAANLNLSVVAAQTANEAADRAESFARYGIKINTDYSSVDGLPAEGNAQYIYLIPNGATGNNSYDEYIWSDSKKAYEKLGTTEIDLSDFLTRSDAEAEYWRVLGVYQGDLNNLYANGVYRLGESVTNLPSGVTYGSQLIVTNSDISCSQIYILLSTGEIYSRGGVKNSGVWSPWVKNANAADVIRKSGDTMTGALIFQGEGEGIKYKSGNRDAYALRFFQGAAQGYGDLVQLGDGGTTIVGAGESADTVRERLQTYDTETLYLAADDSVEIITGADSYSYGNPTVSITPNGLYEKGSRVFSSNNKPAAIDLLAAHPVGTIYISTNSTSPASLFGGSWTAINSGYYIKAVTSGAGTYGNAGLPNITGSVSGVVMNDNSLGSLGAMSYTLQNNTAPRNDGSLSHKVYTVSLNANNSNSIYGNSNTVTPNNYGVYMWRRTA